MGFCWDLGRASLVFLGPYYVTAETHNSFYAGLLGASGWMFLFLGPFTGQVSDRVVRKYLILTYIAVMATSTFMVGVAIFTNSGGWQLMFIHQPLLSFCNVFDMTARMPYFTEVLTASEQDHLMGSMVAIRTVLYNLARVAGCQMVGVVVECFGVVTAFFVVATIFSLGVVMALFAPAYPKASSVAAKKDACENEAPFCNRAFVSIMGVTVLANFFYWSYQPQVPSLGRALQASPSQVGVLASAPFVGGILGSLCIVKYQPKKTG